MASPMILSHQQPPSVTMDTSGDSQLINALAKYVTTGPGARHATQGELQEMIATAVSRPGGRAHLETLCHCDDDHPERTVWQNKATAIGSITLNKTGLSLSLKVPSLDVAFSGDGVGFFRPFSGPLNNGTIWYNGMDNLQPGPADYKLHVDNLTLHLDIYRNQVFVASFTSGPIAFVLAPGVLEGSGNFA
ncbi:hypothetical protein QQX98_009127 [Neonectria punicea]|uniref:Uncharacterized protein n=1 Tax=Neonectria punicea TaxID=979145 RepID=A0ABR1GTD4_9HYPO